VKEVLLPVETDHVKVVHPSILHRHELPQLICVARVKVPALAGKWPQDAKGLVYLLINLHQSRFPATQPKGQVKKVGWQGVVEKGYQGIKPLRCNAVEKGVPYHLCEWTIEASIEGMLNELSVSESVFIARRQLVDGGTLRRSLSAAILSGSPSAGQCHIGTVVHGHQTRLCRGIYGGYTQHSSSYSKKNGHRSVHVVNPAGDGFLVGRNDWFIQKPLLKGEEYW